jgi:hypothetical protein
LGDAARHALKTSVHHELIRRMDLEKLAAIQADEVGGRQRLLAVILQLIGEQSAPLSAPTATGWRRTSSTRSSAWARWSRCCTTHGQRHPGEHLQDGLRGAARRDREDQHRLQGRGAT